MQDRGRPDRAPICRGTTSGGTSLTLLLGLRLALLGSLASGYTTDSSYLEFEPRTYDGTDNNYYYSLWGSVGVTQLRSIAGADYADDEYTPPGDDRPSARIPKASPNPNRSLGRRNPYPLDDTLRREVMTDFFLSAPGVGADQSALFAAWGQLIAFDIFLNSDSSSESFDVLCDDGNGFYDVWCPQGADSDAISFYRSNASEASSAATDDELVRNPVNYATAYLDLDFIYGRSEEEAQALRTLEGGFMNITGSGLPYQEPDGGWKVADQRTAEHPVTFALHAVLLMEHNRCCVDVAPGLGYSGDEDIYQACRGWTIAVYQHITENDFAIRLLGESVFSMYPNVFGTDDDMATDYMTETTDDTTETTDGTTETTDESWGDDSTTASTASTTSEGSTTDSATSASTSDAWNDESATTSEESTGDTATTASTSDAWNDASATTSEGSTTDSATTASTSDAWNDESATTSEESTTDTGTTASEEGGWRRHRHLRQRTTGPRQLNAGADVFATTVGPAAFHSMLPPILRIVTEDYEPAKEDNIELHVACEDLAGLFSRNSIGSILRGAVLSPALAPDAHFSSMVSNVSPLFKLPVDAVQRGRDHGLPIYNDAREAFGLEAVSSFADITDDEEVAELLSSAYGGDIDLLDAVTGALAEGSGGSGMVGDLFQVTWLDQLYRSMAGDRLYHLEERDIESVTLVTLQAVIERTVNVTDLPLAVFTAPSVEVCAANCTSDGTGDAVLSNNYELSWTVLDDDTISFTLRAKDMGTECMLGFGWGGLTMTTAQDFVICEVFDDTSAECIDRSPVSSRSVPQPDDVDSELEVTGVSVDGDWTSVTFLRSTLALDDQDYDIQSDLDAEVATEVIFSYKEGAGVSQHPNANRGAATISFATGAVTTECSDDTDFISLHGALMLAAFFFIAPLGIYYARYCKGQQVVFGNEWYMMHQELMIITSEAVLPMGITAIFALDADHSSQHARWGFFMIGAIALQVMTGFLRSMALNAKHSNFSLLHRFNKYFHIWVGRFAYVAGVVQCYRGLERVSDSEQLLLSAGEGLDLKIGNFGYFQRNVFPAWCCLMVLAILFLEMRKQIRRYMRKGAAQVCGCVEVVNQDFSSTVERPRLVPRTLDLPIYSTLEFNEKVLNGQCWVLVDGAILDVSEFCHRHPGGARVIMNAVGTDVTHELLGEETSVGNAMSFKPHTHSESAWEIVMSLVKGYIDEDEEEDDDDDGGGSQDESKGEGKGEGACEPGAQGSKDERRAAHDGEVEAQAESKRHPLKAFKAAAHVVMFPYAVSRAVATEDQGSFEAKARRLNSMMRTAELPAGAGGNAGAGALSTGPSANMEPQGSVAPSHGMRMKKMSSKSRALLQRFHVCPLLFREQMGSPDSSRPVHKYVFSCPGRAKILAEAVKGACYFNLRVTGAKGVVQRAYNAYAVRVHVPGVTDTPDGSGSPTTAAVIANAGAARRVTSARETSEGMLCIELRIRFYPDGAMSKLLNALASDPDNPAVQLQGPFTIGRIVPPPVHRNVIMIAAGTGINPMVQIIRDYLALINTTRHLRTRLALLWQVTCEADLFCIDELHAMQAKSHGLLELTILISGDQRKRNIPGDSNARGGVAPSEVDSPGSTTVEPPGPTNSGNRANKAGRGWGSGRHTRVHHSASGEDFPHVGSSVPRMSEVPQKRTSQARALGVGGFIRGKVNRKLLDKLFGENVRSSIASYAVLKNFAPSFSKDSQKESQPPSTGTSPDASQGAPEEIEQALMNLCGTHEVPGKLQVVVSGPAGFVFHVENTLGEMNVPDRAIVFLD